MKTPSGKIGARQAALRIAACALLALALAPTSGQGSLPSGDGLQSVPSTPLAGEFTLAAVGDIIYLRPMLATLEDRSPDMLALLRGANVAVGNFETSAIELPGFQGAPQAESGGTWMIADPATIADLVKMGFDIVSHANNHATDWGVEGMLETIAHLDAAALVHSGTGRTLSAARAPRYLDIAAGRVALVSAALTFTPMSRAADALGEVPGRPGVNAVRTQRVRIVAPADLAVIARIAGIKAGAPVVLDGVRYRASDSAGSAIQSRFELNPRDEAGNSLSVRQARQNSNFVIFSLHDHSPGNASEVQTDAAVTLAHRMIDEGADAVVGHGPHQLRGIEIYKGKPIYYSLGNFAMMNNSLDSVPADMYEQYDVEPGAATVPEMLRKRAAQLFANPHFYESVIAISRYADGRLVEIRLYPIDLNDPRSGAGHGVPHIADAATGRRILERLRRLSAPLGTAIAIEKGVGVIRTGAQARRRSKPFRKGKRLFFFA